VRWMVFYGDGTYLSSDDHTPASIPYGKREGVQVIIQNDDEHRWTTISNCDYYMFDYREPETRWWGGDYDGLNYYLRQPGSKHVLFGTWISKYKFREIFNKAREIFGEKYGYDSTERKP